MRGKIKWIAAALLLFSGGPSFAQDSMGSVEKNFKNTPESQQLGVYWYWIAGNMSKEGVVKDLKAMKSVGINRAFIGMIGENQGAPQGPVRMFTDEWWDILHTMFKTAGELGIEIGMFNSPGWSQSGGPWVEPSQSMRYLGYAKDTLSGPMKFKGKLPEVGEEAQPVRVIAYPLAKATTSFAVGKDDDGTFTFKAAKADTVRSIFLRPVEKEIVSEAALYAKVGNDLSLVEEFLIDRSRSDTNVGFEPFAPIVVSIPETVASEFVLKVKPGVVKSVTLSGTPAVERYPEKSLSKMWQTPHPMWDAYMWRDQPDYKGIPAGEVKDVTAKMSEDGTLEWDVPAGDWVVMRTAMLPTGTLCSPAPAEGTGLETDKMSKKHIRAHFNNYLGQILKRIPVQDRKTFKVCVEDSYETGGQNWTDNMIEEFPTSLS